MGILDSLALLEAELKIPVVQQRRNFLEVPRKSICTSLTETVHSPTSKPRDAWGQLPHSATSGEASASWRDSLPKCRRGNPPGPVAGQVPLLLVISSWGSWISELRTGPLAWAEDLVHAIVRDGPKSGLVVLVTGDRELVTSRMFASITNRAFFPTGTTEEGRLAWPRFAAMKPLKGRAVVVGSFIDVDASVAQLVAPPPNAAWPYCVPPEPARRPFRVDPLPQFLRASDLVSDGRAEAAADSSARPRGSVLLGVGGDENEPAWITLPRFGSPPRPRQPRFGQVVPAHSTDPAQSRPSVADTT